MHSGFDRGPGADEEADRGAPRRPSRFWGVWAPVTALTGTAAVVISALVFALVFSAGPEVFAGDSGPEPAPEVDGCLDFLALAEDAVPIIGPALLTSDDLETWWESTGQGQPDRLSIGIDDLIAHYLDEGEAEGVRGDLAFAQAVLETGYFTNDDTLINNFAGIGHYDHADAGIDFDDAHTGVRAQIQLLKRFALGNDAELAGDEVAPDALASATTWDELAGTWATDTSYWSSLNRLYRQMLTEAGHRYSNLFRSPDHC
jgi:hypothetical protein